jgi:hypothetical protein
LHLVIRPLHPKEKNSLPLIKAFLVVFYANVYLWVGLLYGIIVDRWIMPPADPNKNHALISLEASLQIAILAIGNYMIRSLAHGIPKAAGMNSTGTVKKYKTDFALTLAISITASNLFKKLRILFPNVEKTAEL